ncbi:MAG: Zn-dependent protease [Candidatus Fermentimicrarchaeum limneticum]|uniref:Zn-dependent protease n=1 Tax=Fermentimicrarchaeum limneticum TaxID=2795018 RepID=A0A7D5XCV3_FERL1|nr:MAG: Zn-dependent protease [Candidatus Fermentimicrarchaeum limneticum]
MEAGELQDITISVLAIAIAFSIGKLAFFPIILLTVGVGFVAHELMHRFAANHYGARAFYRAWPEGLLFMLATAIISGGRFLFAAPGAVYIYSSYLSRRENGIISLAGPLTNILLAIVFLFLSVAVGLRGTPNAELLAQSLLSFGTYINLYLAFFNLLPIPPLDGSKVAAWNFPLWAFIMVILTFLLFVG